MGNPAILALHPAMEKSKGTKHSFELSEKCRKIY